MNIREDEKKETKKAIQQKAIIRTEDSIGPHYFMVIVSEYDFSEGRSWNLLYLESGEVARSGGFNHPAHIHNYLNKHYDDYEIIEEDNYEILLHRN